MVAFALGKRGDTAALGATLFAVQGLEAADIEEEVERPEIGRRQVGHIVDDVGGTLHGAAIGGLEDHAEHDYMLFVTEHPEWEAQPHDGSFQAGYGHHRSLADLFRQIGHDERVHKLKSLAALDEPRLRDYLSAALKARSQRLPADHRQQPLSR